MIYSLEVKRTFLIVVVTVLAHGRTAVAILDDAAAGGTIIRALPADVAIDKGQVMTPLALVATTDGALTDGTSPAGLCPARTDRRVARDTGRATHVVATRTLMPPLPGKEEVTRITLVAAMHTT